MAKVFLQGIIEDNIKLFTLPYNWNSFDLKGFSRDKQLWDFQQKAVENALKLLWKYYEDFVDYQHGERLEVNEERKNRLFSWYLEHGLAEDLDIRLDRRSKKISDLLLDYYTSEDSKIPYRNYINRMCFWMATGSGKTLIIIKIIQILRELMQRGEIPQYDILFLTHRDDLLNQFKTMVEEFNYANADKVILRELKEYQSIKRQPLLFGVPVFYYRSDNLSDIQKEKIIDFKIYDNYGKWFIFLDEAHKGDKEDAKRQHIYSILSRNGFLFNFSATFIDPRDKITSVYEFNLSTFIQSGYGKHISILKQEIRAFRENEDYNSTDKQKIVLKSLILLTYIKKIYEGLLKLQENIYHSPLLLVLVNSINKEEADLKLFFREMERIAKGLVEESVLGEAKNELWEELKEESQFIFEEDKRLKIDKKILEDISLKDILKYVYNSESFGEIEISYRPSNRKQIAFKLTTSDRHFALSKTGDIPGWLKEELGRFNVNHRFEEEGFFERINREDSPINILMGSRAFYEGWDSNRPNIINFINIGIGTDAQKFILQSVGRGIRIEPISGKRKRLLNLWDENEIPDEIYTKIKDFTLPLETLFIFGTNRNALNEVIKGLETEKRSKGMQISLFLNPYCFTEKKTLFIPVYKSADYPLWQERRLAKFEVSGEDLELLGNFLTYISDDRILLMRYFSNLKIFPVEKLKIIRKSLQNKDEFYHINSKKSYKNIDILMRRIVDYFGLIPERLREIKKLKEEIEHFKKIKVNFEKIAELEEKIKIVKDYPEKLKKVRVLYGKVSPEEYERMQKDVVKETSYEIKNKRLKIKYLQNHYYLPLILSEEEKIEYMHHIIKTKSEVDFINHLDNYLSKHENKFVYFDWWVFSKVDETYDKVYIPYYNPDANRISHFYPDFIFWLKRDNCYYIVFIDPHGTKHIDYDYKIEGYRKIFEENNGKIKKFPLGKNLDAYIYLFFRAKDINKLPQDTNRKYWIDNIDKVLQILLDRDKFSAA